MTDRADHRLDDIDRSPAAAFPRIALGGSCYWCMEAVFQSLTGVAHVEQGFVAATPAEPGDERFSEAVIVHFDPARLPLAVVLEIHLHTHRSTANHSRRDNYRSAVYTFDDIQAAEVAALLERLGGEFDAPLVTRVLPFAAFKPSKVEYHNYFYTRPERPFCERYIAPKLKVLLERFGDVADHARLKQAGIEGVSPAAAPAAGGNR